MSDREADLVSPTWGTVRALRQRIDELEEQVAQLRRVSGQQNVDRVATVIRQQHGVSPGAAAVVTLLYRARDRYVPNSVLIEGADIGGDTPLRTLTIYVHRLRKLMGTDAIENIHGAGYALTTSGRAFIDSTLQKERAA